MDKELKPRWSWESSGENEKYCGQGSHRIAVADIDEDGKDEILPGTFAIDNDGKSKWGTGLFHNDCAVIADIHSAWPGLEIFYNIETRIARNGVCLVDAAMDG